MQFGFGTQDAIAEGNIGTQLSGVPIKVHPS